MSPVGAEHRTCRTATRKWCRYVTDCTYCYANRPILNFRIVTRRPVTDPHKHFISMAEKYGSIGALRPHLLMVLPDGLKLELAHVPNPPRHPVATQASTGGCRDSL